MNAYFKKTFPVIPEEDRFVVPKQNEEFKDCICICWWQGIENAPEIVKQCVASITAYAGSHPVIVITDDNLKDFVKFPAWLEEKRKDGTISKTHIFDILRLTLLATYGGVWLDSTFFCTGSLESCFGSPVWSIKRPDYRHTSVACGYFANYSFGCDSEHRYVFAVPLDYLLAYWKNNSYMIDYLFLDYLIVLAVKREQAVAEAFESIAPNNAMNC